VLPEALILPTYSIGKVEEPYFISAYIPLAIIPLGYVLVTEKLPVSNTVYVWLSLETYTGLLDYSINGILVFPTYTLVL